MIQHVGRDVDFGGGGKVIPTFIIIAVMVLFHNHQDIASDALLEKLWNIMPSSS